MVLTTPGNVLDVGTTRKHPGIHETEETDSSCRCQQGWTLGDGKGIYEAMNTLIKWIYSA